MMAGLFHNLLASGESVLRLGTREDATWLTPAVFFVVELGIVLLVLGMVLCVYRMMRGPHLADRVLATDALALHVVGLVLVLAVYQGTSAFLDVALVVAIIGFAGTLAFAQYIGARGGQEVE